VSTWARGYDPREAEIVPLGCFNQFMAITTGIFGLFLLACAYSAQYWAKQCRDELREIKEELKKGR
jgi:hypothetical protein